MEKALESDGELEKSFRSYLADCFDGPISDVQRQELRRAFFAGAWHTVQATGFLESPKRRVRIGVECQEFKDAVLRGER